VARELIRLACAKVYTDYFEGVNVRQILQWFDLGGTVKLGENVPSAESIRTLDTIQGLMETAGKLGLSENEPDAVRVSAGEFVLEGLYAHRRISRSEEHGYSAEPRGNSKREQRERDRERERDDDEGGGNGGRSGGGGGRSTPRRFN
jgi:magnesium chelatase subunit I